MYVDSINKNISKLSICLSCPNGKWIEYFPHFNSCAINFSHKLIKFLPDEKQLHDFKLTSRDTASNKDVLKQKATYYIEILI